MLDFGIAKIIRDGEGPGTRSPFASFTWLYAAPEQLDPRIGQSGLATDVYSFALLLAELLTDRVPTEGRDVVSLLQAATDPTVRPTPRQRGANVPDAIEVACRRALAVDPKARFATIGELWAALSAARRPTLPPSVGAASNVPVTKPSAGGPPARRRARHRRRAQPSPARHSWRTVAAAVAAAVTAGLRSAWSFGRVSVGARIRRARIRRAPVRRSIRRVRPERRIRRRTVSRLRSRPPTYGAASHGAAMSPPPMSPPPGTAMYPQRRFIPQGPSSLPIVLAVIGLVFGGLLFGCARWSSPRAERVLLSGRRAPARSRPRSSVWRMSSGMRRSL